MKIRVLGCGTSTGVPVIGCGCNICLSTRKENRRTRASILIRVDNRNILIDTSTDLREQALANNIKRIDAVLFTHSHADHVHGIDELRIFNMMQGEAIPCYGSKETTKRIRTIFDYIFTENRDDGWKPELKISTIISPFKIFDIPILPIRIYHGNRPILGFRIRRSAYITDCSFIPERSLKLLKGLDILIIGALRHRSHPCHFTIQEAIEASEKIKPGRTILTHLSHNVDYVKDNKGLPPSVELAYDGMEITVDSA